jgi:predicted CoA-binding protein
LIYGWTLIRDGKFVGTISCDLPDYNPPSEEIVHTLRDCEKIAMVGLSPKAERDSNMVARYLLQKGFDIVPVNPGQKEILGKKCFRSLRDIPFPVDMANLFLNPERVPAVVDEAIEKKIPVIWMQLGVVHNEAAQKAREAGIQVVMNMCVKIEHERLILKRRGNTF